MSEATAPPATVKKSSRLSHLNYFPPGNRGGLIGKGRRDSYANYVSINVFMPPLVDLEIAVNIPGTPRKLIVNTGEMMPVISFDGTQAGPTYRLRIASQIDGKLSWSPFSLANVYDDSRICWGRGNPVPTSMVAAWNLFWTAPFNADLAPRTSPLGYNEWLRTNPPEILGIPRVSAAAMLRAEGIEQRTERRWPREYNTQGFYGMMCGDDTTRAVEMARLTKRLAKLKDAMSFMQHKVHRLAIDSRLTLQQARARTPLFQKIEEKTVAITRRMGVLRNLQDALSNAVYALESEMRSEMTQLVNRMVELIKKGEPLRGRQKWVAAAFGFDSHRAYRDNQRRWLFKSRSAQTILENTHLPKAQARKYLAQFYIWHMTRAVVRQLRDDLSTELRRIYEEYCERRRGTSMEEHFTSKWKETLDFDEVGLDSPYQGYYTKPKPFAPCDGAITMTSLVKGKKDALDLIKKFPRNDARLNRRDSIGKGWAILDADARIGLFKKVSGGVMIVFHPEVEGWLLTNGATYMVGNSDTLEADVLELETEPVTDEVDASEVMANLTYGHKVQVLRFTDIDRKSVRSDARLATVPCPGFPGIMLIADGWLGLPSSRMARGAPLLGESHRSYSERTNLFFVRGLTVDLADLVPRHTGHAWEAAQIGNHCGCSDNRLGNRAEFSHPWCTVCRCHICSPL